MFKSLTLFLLVPALFLAINAHGQELSPQQQENLDRIQEMRARIFQNMQQKGIDPREFFQQLRQDIDDGKLDPADVQQRLVDQGIIDKQMLTQMQSIAQSAALTGIKERLGASDEEWKLLLPKIQKVLNAQADVQQSGQRGVISNFMSGTARTGPAAKAFRELRAAVMDPKTSPETLGSRLQAWRDAHEKAKAALAAAQNELLELLTVRQEAVLTSIGLLP